MSTDKNQQKNDKQGEFSTPLNVKDQKPEAIQFSTGLKSKQEKDNLDSQDKGSSKWPDSIKRLQKPVHDDEQMENKHKKTNSAF